MARTDDEKHVNIMFDDKAVDVGISKNKAWACTPMAKETVLDIIVSDVAFDEDVVLEEDHGSGDVISCATEVTDVIELLG